MDDNISAILRSDIRKRSGFDVVSHPSIKPLRHGFFRREAIAVAGEAPKDFLRVYEYGRGRKSSPRSWPAHIAKVGHKYYPIESITEHLLTRVGQLVGMQMANSRLMWVRGQLRFLSEYFLRRNESLIHGAEIFAGYLADDRDFVKAVEEQKMSNEIFTVQVVEAAVRTRFPAQAAAILQDLVRLIGFDALVGNNDRHFFNWGVITHISGAKAPRFSPVYDTARALFWNTDEAGLTKFDADFDRLVRKYVTQSYPKTGWDGLKQPNHFQLIRKLAQERPIYRETLMHLNAPDLPNRVEKLLDDEFDGLVSPLRKRFVVGCLRVRMGDYAAALTN
ncbi:MAG: HipA domain-containing protein [Undibacterium sp.]|nr:HipA domain-containing protein [Opitutaceae bacterium]